MSKIKSLANTFWLVTAILIAYSNYLIFCFVPDERIMGAAQRIFYFHVASATSCYIAFAAVLIASLTYLGNRSVIADQIAAASAEVGFVLCSIVLLSGMIWGHYAWNTWFSWEPRLVTFLLLWLIYLSYNLLRLFSDSNRVGIHASILGIIGAFTIPVMIYSIKLLPSTAQVHPQVLEKGEITADMRYALLFTMLALITLVSNLIWLRTRIGILELKKAHGK